MLTGHFPFSAAVASSFKTHVVVDSTVLCASLYSLWGTYIAIIPLTHTHTRVASLPSQSNEQRANHVLRRLWFLLGLLRLILPLILGQQLRQPFCWWCWWPAARFPRRARAAGQLFSLSLLLSSSSSLCYFGRVTGSTVNCEPSLSFWCARRVSCVVCVCGVCVGLRRALPNFCCCWLLCALVNYSSSNRLP